LEPVTLFDKSFLQSLSVDESVWFDNFFRPNVCPLFYVETLADLSKSSKKRNPEREVRIIADKFPEMHGTPSTHHGRLATANLMGQSIRMTGQIMVPTSRLVKVQDTLVAVVEQSHEADAFKRWQEEKFLEIEHLYARAWREGVLSLDLNQVAQILRAKGIGRQSVKTLVDARTSAQLLFAKAGPSSADAVQFALDFFRVPKGLQASAIDTWRSSGGGPLNQYAPYAAHVLTVQFFFQIAMAAHHIPTQPPSNQIDIAYLFYLPFCQIFVSSDKLHRDCAPLFLRNDQEFIWGRELKDDLRKLNQFYDAMPQRAKDEGVMKFAIYPPDHGNFLTARLWDRHVPGWREHRRFSAEHLAEAERYVGAKMSEAVRAPALARNNVDHAASEPEWLMKRIMKQKKGSWWQAPKDLKLPRS
jgi:hypothetical protein